MQKQLLTFCLLLATIAATAQTAVDSNFDFQTAPGKKYSLYIPSSYNSSTANDMMVAFHPFNTARWDAQAWRDTLTVFAETNNLILVCPDGGVDGNIAQLFDYDFTTALLDSVKKWYNIKSKYYAMGFSMGGRATYEYGLANPANFCGFIPIGAAVNGTATFNSNLSNAQSKAYYLVHGTNDGPNVRFTPPRDSLKNNGAHVNDTLMTGVGHTIDFPNRNSILNTAFQYIKDNGCSTVSVPKVLNNPNIEVYPTVLHSGEKINISFNGNTKEEYHFAVFNNMGQKVYASSHLTSITKRKGTKQKATIRTDELPSGVYYLNIYNKSRLIGTTKFLMQ